MMWKGLELVGVKIIFLLRMLILARLLSPDDFGLLAIAMTAIGFLLSITDFGMLPALVQRPEVLNRHYNAAWTVIVSRAAAIAALVFLSAPLIANIFNEPRAIPILQVLALRPLLEAAASIRVADLMRDLKFRPLALIKLSEGMLNTIIAIILARYFGVWALVFGALSGATAYLIMSYIMAPHMPRLFIDFKSTKPLVHFGRWIFLRSLIGVAGGIILNIVISRKLGAAQLGLYFLAARLAFLPSEVTGKVIGTVAFPLYARIQSDVHQVARTFRTLLTGISALIFPIGFLLIALAPSLVHDILGPRWEGSVPVIRIIAFASIIGLAGEIIIPVFKGLGQPYKIAVSGGIQTLGLIVFVWFLTDHFGITGAALAWLPAIAASQIIMVIYIHQILPRPFAGLLLTVFVVAAVSGSGAGAALIISQLIPGLAGFITAVSSALLLIGVGLWVADSRLELGLMDSLVKIFPQLEPFKKLRAAKAGS
jgi:O-antigen/teichoic acid export membrane protein